MKKSLSTEIKAAYEAPKPLKKETFLRNFRQREISDLDFIIIQAGYVRKSSLLISALALFAAAVLTHLSKDNMLFVMSALMPYTAVSIVSEGMRSQACNMSELEMSARFSPKSIMLARMGYVGGAHMLALAMLTPFCRMAVHTTLLQTALYLLTPYMATAALSLRLIRAAGAKAGEYISLAAAVMVSAAEIVCVKRWYSQIADFWQISFLIIILLTATTYREAKIMLRRSEIV